MVITNTQGAFGQTADSFEGGVYQVAVSLENTGSATINRGDLVVFDALESDDQVGVIQYDADGPSDASLSAGIALEEFAAGEVGQVCVHGLAKARLEDDDVTAGNLVKGSTTAGKDGRVVDAAADATSVVGEHIGWFLETSTTNDDFVWVWVQKI